MHLCLKCLISCSWLWSCLLALAVCFHQMCWSVFLLFMYVLSENCVRHPCFPPTGGPRLWWAGCEKSFHQMEVCKKAPNLLLWPNLQRRTWQQCHRYKVSRGSMFDALTIFSVARALVYIPSWVEIPTLYDLSKCVWSFVLQAKPQPYLAGPYVCTHNLLQDQHNGPAQPRGCCAVSNGFCVFQNAFNSFNPPRTNTCDKMINALCHWSCSLCLVVACVGSWSPIIFLLSLPPSSFVDVWHVRLTTFLYQYLHFLHRYDKDIQLFKRKVIDSVKLCNSHLFDQPKIDDPYAIRQVQSIALLHYTNMYGLLYIQYTAIKSLWG